MRSGTTSLFRYLAAHPEIHSGTKKEINLFSSLSNVNFSEIENAYKSVFENGYRSQPFLLEASPNYARNSSVIYPKISSLIPNAKIILMLREPTERAISIYKSIKRSQAFIDDISLECFVSNMLSTKPNYSIFAQTSTFSSADTATGIWKEIYSVSRYSKVVNHVFDNFNANQVFIGFLENLSTSPFLFMQRLCSFLNIDSTFYHSYPFAIENPTISTRWPQLYANALKINAHLEPWLNQNPRVRHFFRNIHHHINQKKENNTQNNDDTLAVRKLKSFYTADYSNLRSALQRGNLVVLPDWIRQSASHII